MGRERDQQEVIAAEDRGNLPIEGQIRIVLHHQGVGRSVKAEPGCVARRQQQCAGQAHEQPAGPVEQPDVGLFGAPD